MNLNLIQCLILGECLKVQNIMKYKGLWFVKAVWKRLDTNLIVFNGDQYSIIQKNQKNNFLQRWPIDRSYIFHQKTGKIFNRAIMAIIFRTMPGDRKEGNRGSPRVYMDLRWIPAV